MIDRLTALFTRRPETAEDWLARMGQPEVSPRDQARFLDWLDADPDNLDRYEAAKMQRAALEPLHAVFETELARLRWRQRRPAASRRFVLAGGLAATAVIGGVMALSLMPERSRLYESAPGQISDVVLADGSKVTLDAGSAIRVALSDDVRRVTLERGAAYFEVAHDADHPFQVGLRDRNVIVTGTRFVTAMEAERAVVSLLEGRVVIADRDAAHPNALTTGLALTPGDEARYRPGGAVVRKARTDLDAATAWRKRRLIFQDAPLSEVVAALSRYSDRPLLLAQTGADDLRVTAILPLEGDAPLIERVDALLPVRVQQTADGRVLIRTE
ncbi:MAG: FecR domain-containing protein [Brevundimonas sp.]|nr:FecR domain-containing protein [Brevundimonas sp.]